MSVRNVNTRLFDGRFQPDAFDTGVQGWFDGFAMQVEVAQLSSRESWTEHEKVTLLDTPLPETSPKRFVRRATLFAGQSLELVGATLVTHSRSRNTDEDILALIHSEKK